MAAFLLSGCLLTAPKPPPVVETEILVVCENGSLQEHLDLAANQGIEHKLIVSPAKVAEIAAFINALHPVTDYEPDMVVIFLSDGLNAGVGLIKNGCVIAGIVLPYHRVLQFLSTVGWEI